MFVSLFIQPTNKVDLFYFMVDRLATSANKACVARAEKATNQKQNLSDVATSHVIIFSGNTQEALCGLTLSDVWSNIVYSFIYLFIYLFVFFSHPTFCVTNTMLDEDV